MHFVFSFSCATLHSGGCNLSETHLRNKQCLHCPEPAARRAQPFICAAVGSVFLENPGFCHRTKRAERGREGQISQNQQLHDQGCYFLWFERRRRKRNLEQCYFLIQENFHPCIMSAESITHTAVWVYFTFFVSVRWEAAAFSVTEEKNLQVKRFYPPPRACCGSASASASALSRSPCDNLL